MSKSLSSLFIILAFFYLSGCGGSEEATSIDRPASIAVSAMEVSRQSLETTRHYAGTVEPLEVVTLSTRISGWVDRIFVKEGERVARGQTLVKLRSDDLQARRSQALAAIAEANAHFLNAQTNLKRIEALFSQQAATRKELDDMRAAFTGAEARMAAAEGMKQEVDAMLSYSILKAPFDGTVSGKMVEEGDLTSPGQPLLTVENVQRMKVIAKVPESDVNRLSAGMKVGITIGNQTGGNSAPLSGTIERILPAADPQSRQFEIQVLIDKSETPPKSGMFARIAVMQVGDAGMLIPAGAIFQRGQLQGVYLVDDDSRARLRWIRTGAVFGSSVEVISGINWRDMVITGDTDALSDGQPVEVQ